MAKKSNWKKIILTFSIAIIFVMFVAFGIEAFSPSPKWDDFCDDMRFGKLRQTQETCEADGGKWDENEFTKNFDLAPEEYICTKGVDSEEDFSFSCKSKEVIDTENGYCDMDFYCREDYDNARDKYNRMVFIVCAIVGFITIFISGMYLQKEAVGSGLLAGGVLTVIYGTMRYWAELGRIVRFVLLGAILALLIWLAYKKVKD